MDQARWQEQCRVMDQAKWQEQCRAMVLARWQERQQAMEQAKSLVQCMVTAGTNRINGVNMEGARQYNLPVPFFIGQNL